MLKVIENNRTHINTTIFHSKPLTTTSTSPLLVLIPGNPGVISYYARYLSILTNNGPSDLEVLGISHAGFTKQFDDKIYTLNEQVEHKIDVIKEFLGKDIHTRDVYIIGHSVGAWITQRIVDQTPEINYTFVGFITPTIIDIHKSTKGSVLWPLSRTLGNKLYESAGLLSKLVSYLPVSIIDYVLDHAVKCGDFVEAKDITKQFVLSPQFVKQSVGLASEEMRTIQSDWKYQEHWFSNHESIQKWIFLTNPDNWVSEQTQKDLTSFIGGSHKNVQLETNNEIRHSFCINQSAQFADITLNALNSLLDD